MCVRETRNKHNFGGENMYRHHPILKLWHRCENDVKNTPGKLNDYNIHTELKTFTASDCKN
jgi:hypothetical protein